MPLNAWRIAVLIVGALAAPAHAADIYRCTMGGRTIYSDEPCGPSSKRIAVKPNIVPGTPNASLEHEAAMGRVAVGMTHAQVRRAWGDPKPMDEPDAALYEGQWIFDRPDGTTAQVLFRDGI